MLQSLRSGYLASAIKDGRCSELMLAPHLEAFRASQQTNMTGAQYPTVHAFDRPSSIPPNYVTHFTRDAADANTILPHYQELLACENKHQLPAGLIWIVCATRTEGSVMLPTLDFILSCTANLLGHHPVYIYSARAGHELTNGFLLDRMKRIVDCLYQHMRERRLSSRRIFSVFAVEPVSEQFARCWAMKTSIAYVDPPFFSGTFSSCTPASLTRIRTPPAALAHGEARLATAQDANFVARMCLDVSTVCPSSFQMTSI